MLLVNYLNVSQCRMPGNDRFIELNGRRGRGGRGGCGGGFFPFEYVARASGIDDVGRLGQDEKSSEIESARDVESFVALREAAGDVDASVEDRAARFILAVAAVGGDAVAAHCRHVNGVT